MPLIIRVERKTWAMVQEIFDYCDYLVRLGWATKQERELVAQLIWDLNKAQIKDLHWQLSTICQQVIDYKRGETDGVYMPYLLKKPENQEKP